MDAKAFLQELKTNRKTQAAAVGFLAVLGFAGYNISAPPVRDRNVAKFRAISAGTAPGAALDSQQTSALAGLPDLARLGKAGELPGDAEMRRDLFLFQGQPKISVPQKAEPPRPKTPEDLEAERLKAIADALQAAKDVENSQKPNDLRYIGFLASRKTGVMAAFIRNSEPTMMRVGEYANPRWKLVEITDKAAIFQNVNFADLRHVMENRESARGAGEES
jgi:hypothetical protein